MHDKTRTIKNSPLTEVLSGALGAGIGGAIFFAALYAAGTQNTQFIDFYRQYADEDSEESREEIAADGTSETEKLFSL